MLKIMLLTNPKKALTALLLAAVGLGTGLRTGPTQASGDAAEKSDQNSTHKAAAGLSPAEFEELKPLLDVKNQPWATIPWKYSITEARKLAAASKKPIFMVINTGNALGCT